jgi:hypothetical protein
VSCQSIPGGYICSPTRGRLSREHAKCWGICETEVSRVVVSQGSPWYGRNYHCVDCGDSWCDEGPFERPFERAWREKAKERHQRMWERACECPVELDEDLYALACPNHPEAV